MELAGRQRTGRGTLCTVLSLRHFRLARSRSLSLGAGAPRRARRIDREHDPRRRPFRFRKNRRCSTGASRRFSYLANSAAGRSMELGRSSCSQLPGRCTSAPAASARAGGQRRALSLRHFRLANGVLYPLAGVAEEFGAAHLDLRGPPGWGAGFLFGDIPVFGGRRWSSGDRSDRRCGRCGATGSSTTAPRFNNCAEGESFSAADRSGQRPIATFGDIRRHRNRLRFA